MKTLQVQHKKSPLTEAQLDALDDVLVGLSRKGVSRRTVARRAGFHPAYISHLLNGTGRDDIGDRLARRVVLAVRDAALDAGALFPDEQFAEYLCHAR
jgi:hypothetical protein